MPRATSPQIEQSRTMHVFDPRGYGPAVLPLLVDAPNNELGPGKPQSLRRAQLAALTPESVVAPGSVKDRAMALACCAGLWLRYDFLDESHHVSQEIETPSGSYWHGIMHRREPDFANAKYWFRRVGAHPVFPLLNVAVGQLVSRGPIHPEAKYLANQSVWDPLRLVDVFEQATDGPPPLVDLCRRIQQREWELLFDYCYRQALASA